jgi:hypothetical protein
MKDLYRCLDDYPAEMLQALADVWQLPSPVGESREALVRLGEGMLASEAIQRVLNGLSADARFLLAEVQAAGSAVAGPQVTAVQGSIRRLGPAGMARERPWLYPENVVEELYYRGLLHRAYGQVGAHYGEIYFVPQQLYDALPNLGADAPSVALAPQPAVVRDDGNALIEDMFAVLSRVRQERVPAPDEEPTCGICPEALAREHWEKRFLGEVVSLRLGLIWALLRHLGLVQSREGYLHPSLRARDWLRLSDERRRTQLWTTWRESVSWDELRLLPGLKVLATGGAYHPAMVRKRLLALWAELPVGQWLSVDSMIHLVQIKRPDVLRTDGGQGWELRDADSGELLSGAAGWLAVEGRLIRSMLETLRWLGVLITGAPTADGEAEAFLITTEGERLLAHRGRSHDGRHGAESREKAAPKAPIADVDEDLTVSIDLADSLYERYQLERFAEWQEQEDERAHYRITADSVWQSQNAGVKAEQMIAFLRRISGEHVPISVVAALRAWAERFGQATIRRAAILQTVDPRTMEQIMAHPGLAELVGEAIKPTVRLVDEEHVETLIRLLQETGIWPRVRM